MRDAVGGAVNLVMIVVFMTIVSGYMAFNVSYMKAFKVKNKIISTVEEFDGQCNVDSDCDKIIKDYMRRIGYNVSSMTTNDVSHYVGTATDYNTNQYQKMGKVECPDSQYCIVEYYEDNSSAKKYHFYKVFTRVTMDIPIINHIMEGFRFFQVTGDTKRMIMTTG